MFEFFEDVVSEIINDLSKNASQMKEDISLYEQQALKAEQEAEKKKEEANREEESIHHYRTDISTYVDEDGKTVEKTETVIDIDADNASLAKANQLRAEAVRLKLKATTLKALVAMIRSTSLEVNRQKQKFIEAMENSKRAISETNSLLNQGASLIAKVMSTFNIPEINDKIVKKYFGDNSANFVRDKIAEAMLFWGFDINPTMSSLIDDSDIDDSLLISDIEDARKYMNVLINKGYITEEEAENAMKKIHILTEDEFKQKYKELSGNDADRYGTCNGFNVVGTHEIYLRDSGDGVFVHTVVHELVHSFGNVANTPETYNGEKVSGRAFNEAVTDIMTIRVLGDAGDSDKVMSSELYLDNAVAIASLRKNIRKINPEEDLLKEIEEVYFGKSDEDIRTYINNITGDETFFDRMCYDMGYIYVSDEEEKKMMQIDRDLLIASVG